MGALPAGLIDFRIGDAVLLSEIYDLKPVPLSQGFFT
jgi:hypothetical protein